MIDGGYDPLMTESASSSGSVLLNIVGDILSGGSIFQLVIFIVFIISLWKIFEKANEAGWKAIVPIYNIVVLCQIARFSVWWILGPIIMMVSPFLVLFGVNALSSLFGAFMLIFLLGLVLFAIGNFLLIMDLGRAFGKSTIWSIFLLFLAPFIGYPILAFGDAKYKYAESSELDMPPPPAASNEPLSTAQSQPIAVEPIQPPPSSIDAPPAPIAQDSQNEPEQSVPAENNQNQA